MSPEIIAIDKEIKVVGLSLQKSGLPMNYEAIGRLWDIFRERRGAYAENAVVPHVEYGVCICDNWPHEYLAGRAVSEIGALAENKARRFPSAPETRAVSEVGDLGDGWISFIIPPGRYAKVSEELGGYAFDIEKWAEENGLSVKDTYLCMDVHPAGAAAGDSAGVYYLWPIK